MRPGMWNRAGTGSELEKPSALKGSDNRKSGPHGFTCQAGGGDRRWTKSSPGLHTFRGLGRGVNFLISPLMPLLTVASHIHHFHMTARLAATPSRLIVLALERSAKCSRKVRGLPGQHSMLCCGWQAEVEGRDILADRLHEVLLNVLSSLSPTVASFPSPQGLGTVISSLKEPETSESVSVR